MVDAVYNEEDVPEGVEIYAFRAMRMVLNQLVSRTSHWRLFSLDTDTSSLTLRKMGEILITSLFLGPSIYSVIK